MIPAPNQASAQVRPIPMAPRIRLNHFFIMTSLCWTDSRRRSSPAVALDGTTDDTDDTV